MSDELALGALRAAARAGRAVPGSVAITGWDDSEAAAPAGLTTVRQSLRDRGSRCARIALGREPSAAPIRATTVKRAYEPGPVTTCAAGWGWLFFWILPRGCWSFPAARPGSSWSARSRAAARTNELDAGKRREILGGGEGFGYAGSRAGSRCVAGGVVSQAPIRRRAGVRAAAMTMCPGPGCSVRRSSAAQAPAHAARTSVPGAWRPSRLHGCRGGAPAPAACMSESRCQARVSSLRAIAMVAIFFPRRLAMLA
jgi:hypothetical protein